MTLNILNPLFWNQMKLQFYKYQGAGNDFILIDNRENNHPWNKHDPIVQQLCDRRLGIGADGLMLLQSHPDYDFEMIYYNADGGIGSMCGNGGRCIVAFAKDLGIIKQSTHFLASDGVHLAHFEPTAVSLQMINVKHIENYQPDTFVLNTGSPHYVKFVNDIHQVDVFNEGKTIRYHKDFEPAGINVNFVQEMPDVLRLRTYERGVENETYACGTGATAAAMAYAFHRQLVGSIELTIEVLGGLLRINFDYNPSNGFSNVFLTGPAQKVFEGFINNI